MPSRARRWDTCGGRMRGRCCCLPGRGTTAAMRLWRRGIWRRRVVSRRWCCFVSRNELQGDPLAHFQKLVSAVRVLELPTLDEFAEIVGGAGAGGGRGRFAGHGIERAKCASRTPRRSR